MKHKLMQGRLGSWWEMQLRYDLEFVYHTSKTNSADSLSRRPNYMAATEAEDKQQQA
jgi:hypothetical protein